MAIFDWDKYQGKLHWLKDRTVYLTVAGSVAYGTNIASSDVDYRGIAIAPANNYLGVVSYFEQEEIKDPDVTIFDIRKLVKLASDSNPNILDILFTDLSDVCDMMWYGQELRGMRDLFVTKRARATFAGYATSQLKKIKHNTEHSTPGSPRYDRIQQFGYCTKNAMHLVRLLRMCREILETGQVNVKRKDADELLAIRNGAWSLKELCEYAESEDKELDAVCEKSSLPEQPDMKEIDRRTVEIMKMGLEWL